MKSTVRYLWICAVVLVALACCGVLPARVWTSWTAPAEGGMPEPPAGMQYIAGGVYAPLFKEEGAAPSTPVAPVYLDIYGVDLPQFLVPGRRSYHAR